MDWVSKLFLKSESSSKDKAKRRLKLVLMHDRASINPMILEKIKGELLQVIEKYIEIDSEGCEISLDDDERSVALIANIPIKSVREKHLN